MTCNTDSVNISQPASSSLPNIPGFGIPKAPTLPANPFQAPSTQPEDSNALIQSLSLILPTGKQTPNASSNFSKDINDALFSLMEKVSPFLTTFKFFMPVLKLITGILEVICALINPFSLWGAINRLFNEYLPEFLALYPAFSMIVLILSILKLLLTILEYYLNQITIIYNDMKQNLKDYAGAMEKNNKDSITAITNKMKSYRCNMQNLLVMFNMIASVAEVINDLLNFALKIPCSNNSDCCNTNVCPAFLENSPISADTGILQYYPSVTATNSFNVFSHLLGNINNDTRQQAYQYYDPNQNSLLAFSNIFDPSDATHHPKPIFYPTDSAYTGSTPTNQVPYTIDIRIYYEPRAFTRSGTARYIRFKQCVVISQGSYNLINYDNSTTRINTGVLLLSGGLGYEDDGVTVIDLPGTNTQATLETFITLPATSEDVDLFGNINYPDNVVIFNNSSYTFNPNFEYLFAKSLISAGCAPSIKISKSALATTFPIQTIPTLPDFTAIQNSLANEIDNLFSNLNSDTLDTFYNNTVAITNTAATDINGQLEAYFDLAFDHYNSSFTISPSVQWQNQGILVSIVFKDRNDNIISDNLNSVVSTYIKNKIQIVNSFGKITSVSYDGSEFFIADITTTTVGSGSVYVIYNNEVLSILTPNSDPTQPAIITKNIQDYTFINSVELDGAQRRTDIDIA